MRRILPLATFVMLQSMQGPGAVAGHDECMSCHFTPGGNAAPGPPDSRVCIGCHFPTDFAPPTDGDEARATHSRPAHFDAPASGDCVVCHDPHISGPGPRLRELPPRTPDEARLDPVSRVCAQCHTDQAHYYGAVGHRRHPVGVSVPGGAPASSEIVDLPLVDRHGTPERHDDVLSCISCHTTHERRADDLLRWGGRDELVAACTSCHRVGGEPRGAALLQALRSTTRPRRPSSRHADGAF